MFIIVKMQLRAKQNHAWELVKISIVNRWARTSVSATRAGHGLVRVVARLLFWKYLQLSRSGNVFDAVVVASRPLSRKSWPTSSIGQLLIQKQALNTGWGEVGATTKRWTNRYTKLLGNRTKVTLTLECRLVDCRQ